MLAIQRVDRDLAPLEAGTGLAVAGAGNLVLRVGAIGAGLLGGLALLLAMVGLYGVIADLVLRRTREIGLRMAIGADARQVMRMVLVDGARPVLDGLALGGAVCAITWMALGPLLGSLLPASILSSSSSCRWRSWYRRSRRCTCQPGALPAWPPTPRCATCEP